MISPKLLFPALIFLLLSFTIRGQNSQPQSKTLPNSFVIYGNLSPEKLNFYTKSIEAADFEQFRLRDETIFLKFKNGFEIELLSAKALMIKNKIQDIDYNKYTLKTTPSGYKYPLFEIHESGFITAEVLTNSK